MSIIELKAFVPARDYALSKRFYQHLGFTLAWDGGDLAYFHLDGASFLLQDFYVEAHATNFTMHMLVDDVDACWQRWQDAGIAETYQVRLEPPAQRPWRMRDFILNDPSGVLWRIAQNDELAA